MTPTEPEKKVPDEVKKTIEELAEKYKEKLYEIFAKDTFDLTFDEREKLIDTKIDTCRGDIIETHIDNDRKKNFRNDNPLETYLCNCGRESVLCKDTKGNPKIFERTIQTKRGPVKIKEYGYYCSKCRRSFFPSKKKVKVIQRKLQS